MSPSDVCSHPPGAAVLSICGYGASGSVAVATLFHMAASTATAMAAAVDGPALSIDIFGFFGVMISSRNNHGGCQCYSRPRP